MNGQLLPDIPLAPMTTFGLGGPVRHLGTAQQREDIPLLMGQAQSSGLPVSILGGGSNIIANDQSLERFVLKIEIPGFSIVEESSDTSIVTMGAGAIWDDCVRQAVERDLSGIEAMSAIPGTAGATPIQNVGAYGQEIADTFVSLTAYDRQIKQFVELGAKDCGFRYRDSIFKREGRDRYIICDITLKLSKNQAPIPHYPGVEKYFAEHGIAEPTLQEIRQAITTIRQTKLPDPRIVPNVGSFFKNPIIPVGQFDSLHEQFPAMASFPAEPGMVKLAAGWLVEQSGLKGFRKGNLATYEHNALVITRLGETTFREVMDFKDEIIHTVKQKFGITLDPEPIFWP